MTTNPVRRHRRSTTLGPTHECAIVGPYLPTGDTEWICQTHQVEAVLIDPAKHGTGQIKRTDMRCPAALTTPGDTN
jgi:hypothetical protein